MNISPHKLLIYCALFLLIYISFEGTGCSGGKKNNQEPVTIFCASGLSSYISELVDSLKEKGINPVVNIASSGILARQIIQGSNADFFLSANKSWADYVDSAGFADTIIALGKNKLFLIGQENSKFKTLGGVIENAQRISMGSPEFVPAGTYAKEALENMGYYKQIENRLVFTMDVKSALRLVEMGECEAGFVYKSDAIASKKIKIIEEIPDTTYSPINFYLVKVKKHINNQEETYRYFLSKESVLLLEKNGLIPLWQTDN
jgi:molybdate transport system substrate-binding protein